MRCSKHPKYMGLRKPRVKCEVCERIYSADVNDWAVRKLGPFGVCEGNALTYDYVTGEFVVYKPLHNSRELSEIVRKARRLGRVIFHTDDGGETGKCTCEVCGKKTYDPTTALMDIDSGIRKHKLSCPLYKLEQEYLAFSRKELGRGKTVMEALKRADYL